MGRKIARNGNGDASQPSTRWPPHWAVVLAGGNGTRLRAFVRQVLGSDRPKQFCRIIGTRSMLRHTWDRAVRVVAPHRVVTVVTAGQEHYLEVEGRHGAPSTVVVQPVDRGTAPGLLLPLLWIARHSPAATVAVFPADHFIWEEDRFERHIRAALAVSQHLLDRLVFIGVKADRPETKYGWIAPGERLDTGSAAELYTVRGFWEKPDQRTAAHFFAEGYLWNTLVIIGHIDVYLRLAQSCVPEVFAPLRALAACLDTRAEAAAMAMTYGRLPSVDLSRAMLAGRPELLSVLAATDVCWSDWGEPDGILQTVRRFDLRPRWLPACDRVGRPPVGAEAGGSAQEDALRDAKEAPPGPGEVSVAEPMSPITAAGDDGKGAAHWRGNYGDDGEGGSRVPETAGRRR
ncbi:MAG: sugar phosphate nucleotidyltransferase [Candidatus Methylomirabilota bacterium]|jgi:mannose-1-phosphate guanylyltransferase